MSQTCERCCSNFSGIYTYCDECIRRHVNLCIGCRRYTHLETKICVDCIGAFNSIPTVKCSYCEFSGKLFEKAKGYFKEIHYFSCNFMLPYTYPCHWTESDLPKVLGMIKNEFMCKKCFLERNPEKYECGKCHNEYRFYDSEFFHCSGGKIENFKKNKYNGIEGKFCKNCDSDICYSKEKKRIDEMSPEEKSRRRRQRQRYMDML